MDTRRKWSPLRIAGLTVGLLTGVPAAWLAIEGLVMCLDDPGDPMFGFSGLGGALLVVGLLVGLPAGLMVYLACRSPRQPS